MSYLNTKNIPIGVVQSITGIKVLRFTLNGISNHAGATPMNLRYDPLVAAAEAITTVEKIVNEHESNNLVGTVGKIHCTPNVSNVIPDEVNFTVDIRDVDMNCIEEVCLAITQEIQRIGERRSIQVAVNIVSTCRSSFMSETLTNLILQKSQELGIPSRKMRSGAVHDAAVLAPLVPVGFIFIPSIDGYSHSPREKTSFEDIEKGCQLLLEVVKAVSA